MSQAAKAEKNLPAVTALPPPPIEVADGPQLEIGIAAAARDLLQQLLRAGQTALRQHEQRALLQLGRLRALQQVFEQRQRALGVGLHDAVKRHQLEVLVGFAFGRHGLPGGLLDFDLERLGVVEPAAAGVRFAKLGELGQCFVTPAELV